MQTPRIGSVLGHYSIVDEIARGGMGVLYRATDLKLDRTVALKVIPEHLLHSPAIREAFETEARALSRISHPNVETVFDVGSEDGLDYLVTEYIPGRSLAETLFHGRLDEDEQVSIAAQVAQALHHAHSCGVVHGDVTPANIMIMPDGRVKLVDFGLSRLVPGSLSPADPDASVDVDTLRGTLPYMAPEQILGGRANVRSDIYSLGVVLHEMATGRRPFQPPLMTDLMAQIVRGYEPLPRERWAGVSSRIRRVIEGCMEKDPRDRFPSAANLAAILEGRRRRPMPRLLWPAVVIVALAAGILTYALVAPPSGRAHFPIPPGVAPTSARSWMLVAEFDGPANDPELAAAVRDQVSAALDQSRVVTTVPREQIEVALGLAGKPGDAHVGPALAKELAYRSAVRTVLEGSVGRMGPGYSVVLRVTDAESGAIVLTERTATRDQDGLVPALERLVRRLRADLGENPGLLAAVRGSTPAATPSFEAYRLYVRAKRLASDDHPSDAITVLREALDLDPDFALAWWQLAAVFQGNGELDSARAAMDEARRRPDRLSRMQRLQAEAFRHVIDEDPVGALAAYERMLKLNPSSQAALGGRTFALYALGRYEDVLDQERAQRYPFGMSQVALSNHVGNLLRAGHVPEARALLPRFTDPVVAMRHRVAVELAAENWTALEAILDSTDANPRLPGQLRVDVLGCLASARAARGAFLGAEEAFERGERLARTNGGGRLLKWQLLARGRLALTMVSHGAIPLPTDAWTSDSSAATLITRGLRAAIGGDARSARRLLDAARSRPDTRWPLQGASATVLAAQIALLEGRSADAVRSLRPVAAQPREFGDEIHYRIGMSFVRWILADAYERLGQPDSAAMVLERITSDPGPWLEEIHLRGILLPYAHRRLALLNARMGRIRDAERHWRIFDETVRTPDPAIEPLIVDARSALASARGLAASGTH